MEQLITSLDKLLKYKNEDPSRFYTLLSDCILTESDEKYFFENVLPQVYYLYHKQVLRKDLVYLALLANRNDTVLDKFIQYDKSVFVLNIEDPVSLYDYYIYERKHWVLEIVNNPSAYGLLLSNKTIYSKLNMIQYITATNAHIVDIEHVSALSTHIDREYLQDFWSFYIDQITNFMDMVEFCKSIIEGDVNNGNLFKCASCNSLLDLLSINVDLKNTTHWNAVLTKLKTSREVDQLNVFTGFVIMAMLINLLLPDNYTSPSKKKDFVNTLFEDVKTKLLELQDKQLQIQLLEDIFYLLFHRTGNDFTCKEKEIRFVLFLLKSVIDDLKLKKPHDKESNENKRLFNLNLLVTDALWRLDLIVNTRLTPKIEEQLLSYMLSPPESLIHICLKQENFERAYQVIEIFNLRESDLANEVKYAESFLKFKKFLRKNGKLKVEALADLIEEFIKANSRGNLVENVKKLPDFEQVLNFQASTESFMTVFDLALTEPDSWEESQIILQLAHQRFNANEAISSDFLNFYKKITEIGNDVALSIPEILTCPYYALEINEYREKEAFYDKLSQAYDDFHKQDKPHEPGIFNKSHPNHKTMLTINDACLHYKSTTTPYLVKVFNYLKAFSKILYIEQNSSDIISKGKNTSFFDIFKFNRSELTGKLLFERQLDPTEFEKYFGKLKLDFLYHVVGNCFPTINLHVQEHVTIEELYHDNMLYIPSRSIITYIQKRNWLLAFILNEMYKVEGQNFNVGELRLKTFFNYLNLPKIQHLKALFDKNDIVTALQNCISAQKVKLYFREQIVEHDAASLHSQNSNNSDICETGEEIQEDTKTTNWKRLYDIVESIPENQMKKKGDLIVSKNDVLSNLVQDGFEPEFYRYAFLISDRDLRIETICNNFVKWPGNFACDIIKAELSKFDGLLDSKVKMLRDWLQHIELNEQLKIVLDIKSWHNSYIYCKNEKEKAMEKILLLSNIDYLLGFINLYKPLDDSLCKINSNYLTKIMDLNVPLAKIKKLLDSLPFQHALDICHNLLTILRNLDYLQFVADYLNDNVSDDSFIKTIQISLNMLSAFTPLEQDQFFCLINEPLSILEVLLMNTKLDKLGTVLEVLKKKDLHDCDIVSGGKIDELLRKYAEKSLDFRVITQNTPRARRSPESHKLLQSLDSLSYASENKQFVVPETAPLKEEWVQNDEVVECMCCQQTTFSMFNRRHHCRRCGRVVCYSCSTKRMLVPSYGDILVRVCKDCYVQTLGTEEGETPSARSPLHEYWLLNDDLEHNKITREEFSYEHAPSTSLCFSILKHHSKNVQYPRFLLEQCEVMLKFLNPGQELTQEIDYILVLKMLRSLASAAKLLSTENSLSSGVSTSERILAQVDLLELLSERGCLSLMSFVGSQSIYGDTTVLRRLRDKLLQREQWNLALEVSTKAGLDNAGVFVAWGKSCLKAGSLMVAREKFHRVLDKNLQYDASSTISRSESYRSTDSLLTVHRSRFSSRISTASTSSETKPLKDPPVLTEIIQILETKTRPLRPEIVEQAEKFKLSGSTYSLNQTCVVQVDTALSVKNRIKNLSELNSGNYSLSQERRQSATKPIIDPIFYTECIYYLSKYGTHTSLLEFYIRHDDVREALIYVIENKLSCDVFVELYMRCLKEGIVGGLQEQMSQIDSSLDLWKDYLRQICRHLEKQHLLNSLYQLQLYIGDYVRASMTCIRFYQDNVKSFIELANNVNYLRRGEQHLRQILEQDQWVEVASVGASSSSKDSFEERMLSNPDLVMKIDNKDVHKHIDAVKKQIEVVEFLSKRETAGVDTRELLRSLAVIKDPTKSTQKIEVPTLFGSPSDKVNLAVMVIISGETVEEGFVLATEIIDDFKLRPIKVYCLAGKHFAKSERYSGISQLVNCIKSTGLNDSAISDMLDEMLVQTVATLIKENVGGTKVEDLIKLIKDKATKISAYIEAKQLKTAYYLAVKYKRTADIRRIQREAELLNMPTIKALCQKVLQSSPHS